MKKERLSLEKLTEKPVEEYVEVKIPKSTYKLFNAVAGHPIVEDLTAYNRHVKESVSINGELYPLPAEMQDTGAPKGQFFAYNLENSAFYPGVPHPYYVYVPAAYTGEEPAHLAVFYDAPSFVLDKVTRQPMAYPAILHLFDNLIAAGKLPVTIVVFISFGLTGPGQPMAGLNEGAVNRSLEYDTVSDRNARFTTEELLPLALEDYSISAAPKDHVILGMSSSGIAAFMTAWFKPELFGNVYSASPSFADIRGGRVWPTVIRVEDKKPLRLFTVAGKHDINNFFGNWLVGSYDVTSALHYKGYDQRFYLSKAGHSMAVFLYCLPQGLQWLFGNREPDLANMEEVTFDNELL